MMVHQVLSFHEASRGNGTDEDSEYQSQGHSKPWGIALSKGAPQHTVDQCYPKFFSDDQGQCYSKPPCSINTKGGCSEVGACVYFGLIKLQDTQLFVLIFVGRGDYKFFCPEHVFVDLVCFRIPWVFCSYFVNSTELIPILYLSLNLQKNTNCNSPPFLIAYKKWNRYFLKGHYFPLILINLT